MSLGAAKLEIVNGRIDQQMCQLFHTEVLRKFSHDSQTEGKSGTFDWFEEIHVIYCCHLSLG